MNKEIFGLNVEEIDERLKLIAEQMRVLEIEKQKLEKEMKKLSTEENILLKMYQYLKEHYDSVNSMRHR